ncbi:hypothetical protein IMAU80125_00047 [Lactiplantibacillus plantarum]|jgi:hypothetical protein|nr:hypothetical protein [Lactiplantibacillus plantarum]
MSTLKIGTTVKLPKPYLGIVGRSLPTTQLKINT